MGTRKSSSSSSGSHGATHGKTVKAGSKNSSNKDKISAKVSDKVSKPVSKLSSIKQALFGGNSPKKAGAAPSKPQKKEAAKAHPKNAKSEKAHEIKAAHDVKAKAKEQPAPKKAQGAENRKKEGTASRGSTSKSGTVSVRSSLLETGETVCREVACEGLATSGGYCRLHYIKNWKKIKRKEVILKEGKLNQYIEELVAKYPDKYIEAIRQDLANDKDFAKVIYDLDLDESVDDFDVDSEGSDTIIDSIKRDFDDEGDTGF